ncbi:membrane protein [Pseudomonas phage PAP02]|uniref:membrane protein n=1 Tax=Pseudomonas phage PAP02 TaxID=2713224 RepID=UPI00232990A9|nr:membrane protein [Pseudomonas phage PAP02]QKE55073.1 membrane protein [Pseudomonas phage PAP02]
MGSGAYFFEGSLETMSKHRLCKYCGKPIVLVPSAEERAKKFGESSKFYLNLFYAHGDCIVKSRG